jgi:hypothetical protein
MKKAVEKKIAGKINDNLEKIFKIHVKELNKLMNNEDIL